MQQRNKGGRPRKFVREEALDRALALFWERGYEATSMADLAAAMGMHSPSIYAAFGSKEDLFREAAARYEQRFASRLNQLLEEAPTAVSAIRAFFAEAIETYVECARGCFLVMATANGPADSVVVRERLACKRERGLRAIRARLERGRREGDLDPACDVDALAVYVITVAQGLSMQAREGASRETLAAVTRTALAGIERYGRPEPGQ
ncbi:TetR/AcrR family transcriptional regulator [Geminicoccus flavidas]|uniref:TetR/AcrR family transcriptional regulator n=1 Tax=Geminicoccus flavidas TaxID=2506407 RepID=UPI00135BBA0A|nr:TetR/AcrR family transcriptional regulator [Geminicoccus flavidas]